MSDTMIHPETGATLRRRKRTETITYQGQSRTVEVEGWFPDDDGDGILVGADSKPLDDALAEMKAGWPDPARPGVPLNPDREGWHWVKREGCEPDCFLWLAFYRGWMDDGSIINAPQASYIFRYLGPCLTPAEVDARIASARKDGMKDAAKWHEVRSMELSGKAGVARNFRQLLRQSDFHMESAAAIRALKGEGNE